MPDALGRTPSAPAVEGTRLTLDNLLKQPTVIARLISAGPQTFLSDYLFRRSTTESGAVIFSQARSNGAYPAKGDVREIAPMADFPMIDIGEDTQDTAIATKNGAAFRVSDESVQRKAYDEVNQAIVLTRNALVRQNSARMYQAFIDAGVPTMNAVAPWNGTGAEPRRDLRGAQARVRGAGFGYDPRTVIAHPDTLFELEMNPLFATWMPRENAALNPFLNAGLNGFLNVEYIESVDVPEDEVIVLTRNRTGVDVVEREVEVESIREAGQKTLFQVSRRSVPIITDPLSAIRVQGVIV